MESVNKTLYIPLYGKALVSKKGIILDDKKAEEIWESEGFPLKGKSKSKWLAYYMAMRAKVFDRWVTEKIRTKENCVVLHIGCGVDSRIERVSPEILWYDIDFPSVIEARKKYFAETPLYRMLAGDVRQLDWLLGLPNGNAVVLLEGVSMYLSPTEIKTFFSALAQHFASVDVLMDAYTEFGAKMSKYRNPVNDVGVTAVYGFDNSATVAENTGICLVEELTMTPPDLIEQLVGLEKFIFQKLYAGKIARKTYRLYAYGKTT